MTRSEQHGYKVHLTMEQLSAFLDKQLPPSELAFVDEHLHSCKQCRLALADLHATVALVRAMPQPALPRSFTLPANLTPLPIDAGRQMHRAIEPARRQPAARNGLRRAMRFASAIAAVLGLLFILSGLLPAIPLGQGGTTATGSSAPAFAPNQSDRRTPAISSQAATPAVVGTHIVGTTQSGKVGQPRSTPAASIPTHPPATARAAPPLSRTLAPPALPPYLDLATIEGRLSLGLALALLGMIGLLLTRRRYRQVRY